MRCPQGAGRSCDDQDQNVVVLEHGVVLGKGLASIPLAEEVVRVAETDNSIELTVDITV